MTTVDFQNMPAKTREEFFLRVAKQANEMQRELVKKARSMSPRGNRMKPCP